MTPAEMNEEMLKNFHIAADTKPWSWEWKLRTATVMLEAGRPIDFVKKTLGLTYVWMIKHGLIEWKSFKFKARTNKKDAKGEYIFKEEEGKRLVVS